MNDATHLIIAGATKCATTSLFTYLSAHPDVCPARFKETRFFLDPDYPIAVRREYAAATRYADLFDTTGATVNLEATPDYLYSSGTAQRIRTEVSDPRLLFILRHPIDRLVSWYRFARQIGELDSTIAFDDYVRSQLRGVQSSAQHHLALRQGRYSEYLPAYADLFDRRETLIVLYEDLARDPLQVVTQVCAFAGLDGTFFEDFEFGAHNQTRQARSPKLHGAYRRLQTGLRTRVSTMPGIRRSLRSLGRVVDALYSSINTTTGDPIVVSPDLRSELETYYRCESASVGRLAGMNRPPWPDLDAVRPPVTALLQPAESGGRRG